ncbi:MAG: diguanylate cyclase [Pseudanabaenaceae cyanobacterium bins.68]|nr:diguanylate cyclase [Pseudanabaenaceae cyanobacterium bins.68]
MEKGTILVVDDTPSNLKLLAKMLESHGYSVRTATSGELALALVEQQVPDLVLLDINMPEMSGYEVCAKLKQNLLTKEMPVVFISSSSEIEDKLQGFSVGGTDYITKDFQIAEVIARVENQLTIRRLQKRLEQQNAELQTEVQSRRLAEQRLQAAIFELERLVNLDGLTSVANRRRFDDFLDCSWQDLAEEELPLCLIMCDVDFFKSYNDTYGHLEGDRCLKAVAHTLEQQINQCYGSGNGLVARYGGEEFSIVLPNLDLEQAIAIAEKLRRSVKSLAIPHINLAIAHKRSEVVTMSLGVAVVVPAGNQPKFLITQADRALYEAKRLGRDRTCYVQLGKFPGAELGEPQIQQV